MNFYLFFSLSSLILDFVLSKLECYWWLKPCFLVCFPSVLYNAQFLLIIIKISYFLLWQCLIYFWIHWVNFSFQLIFSVKKFFLFQGLYYFLPIIWMFSCKFAYISKCFVVSICQLQYFSHLYVYVDSVLSLSLCFSLPSFLCFLSVFSFLRSTEDWTQHLRLANLVLDHWSYNPSAFAL
jgi:hypothetical protein